MTRAVETSRKPVPEAPRRATGWERLRARLREAPSADPQRGLYLDASLTCARSVRTIAARAGWRMDCTRDAHEAFGLCLEYRYQAILVQLGGRHATQILEALRELQRDTGFVWVRDAKPGLVQVPTPDSGVVGLLQKPWSEASVLDMLERAAARSAFRRRERPE